MAVWGIDEKSYGVPIITTLYSSFVDVSSSFKPVTLCAVERGNSIYKDGDLYLYKGQLFNAHSNFSALTRDRNVRKVIATSRFHVGAEKLPEDLIKEYCKRDGIKYVEFVKYWTEWGDNAIRQIYDLNTDGTVRTIF